MRTVEVPVLTWKAVIFAIALAFVLGYIIRATGFVWTWPGALAIVITAWWVYGQKQIYHIPDDYDD